MSARGAQRRWPVHRVGVRCSNAPSDRIRSRFEPRFPHVHPHRLRHSFSMRTLEYLVTRALPAGRQAGRRPTPTGRTRRWRSTCPRPTRCWCCGTCSVTRRVLDHREVPAAPGHDPHLPGGLRAGRNIADGPGSPTPRPNARPTPSSTTTPQRRRADAGHRDRRRLWGSPACSATAAPRSSHLDGLPCRGTGP